MRHRQRVPIDHHARVIRILVSAEFDQVGKVADLRTSDDVLISFAVEQPISGVLLAGSGEHSGTGPADPLTLAQHASGIVNVADPSLLW